MVAPRKFDVLSEGKYASFNNIKFPKGSYQSDNSET